MNAIIDQIKTVQSLMKENRNVKKWRITKGLEVHKNSVDNSVYTEYGDKNKGDHHE